MYPKEYKPDHPRADVTGFVPLHILVAELALGRPLEPGELVHHKDFNKTDSSPSNLLFPITRKQHQQLPAFQARFILMKGLYDEFLDWWYRVKDEVDPLVELEGQLVKLQNEKRKLEAKMINSRKVE